MSSFAISILVTLYSALSFEYIAPRADGITAVQHYPFKAPLRLLQRLIDPINHSQSLAKRLLHGNVYARRTACEAHECLRRDSLAEQHHSITLSLFTPNTAPRAPSA